MGRPETSLGSFLSHCPPVLRQSLTGIWYLLTQLGEPANLRDLCASASQCWDYKHMTHACLLVWVLTLARQALYSLSHRPSLVGDS